MSNDQNIQQRREVIRDIQAVENKLGIRSRESWIFDDMSVEELQNLLANRLEQLEDEVQSSPSATHNPGESTAARFVKLTHTALEDDNLPDQEFRLLGMLIKYARQKGFCWPSVETLANDMPTKYRGKRCEDKTKRNHKTIERGLKHLRDLGYVEILKPSVSRERKYDTRDKKGRWAKSNTIVILPK